MTVTQHQQHLPIRDYGDFDPLRETLNHVNDCVCGCKLTKEHVVNDVPLPVQMGLAENAQIVVKRYFVKCPDCGSLGPATKQSLYAVLQWNMCKYAAKPSYKDLPLFGLAELAREEAVAVLQAIRTDLRTRIADCEQRLQLSDKFKHPGPRYHEKLLAYRAWNYYALCLASDDDFFRPNPNCVKGMVNAVAH